MQCEEESCKHRTRAVSVYATQCPVDGCMGAMHSEYSASDLYTQLQYYLSLFDSDRYVKKLKSDISSKFIIILLSYLILSSYHLIMLGNNECEIVLRAHQETLSKCLTQVKHYADLNARGYVDMKELFSFQSI